jgi:hypothetical protein
MATLWDHTPDERARSYRDLAALMLRRAEKAQPVERQAYLRLAASYEELAQSLLIPSGVASANSASTGPGERDSASR